MGKTFRYHTDKEVMRALKAGGGFISKAAKIMGVTYQCIWDRCKKSPKLKRRLKAISGSYNDLAEDVIVKTMKRYKIKGCLQSALDAAKFRLKYKARHRGYVNYKEIAGVPGKPIEHIVTFKEKALRNLPREELRSLASTLGKLKEDSRISKALQEGTEN